MNAIMDKVYEHWHLLAEKGAIQSVLSDGWTADVAADRHAGKFSLSHNGHKVVTVGVEFDLGITISAEVQPEFRARQAEILHFIGVMTDHLAERDLERRRAAERAQNPETSSAIDSLSL